MLLFLVLFQLPSGILQFFHPFQFIRCILQAKVGVGVQRHTDITMPHQVLECLGIHAGFRHVAATKKRTRRKADALILKNVLHIGGLIGIGREYVE